MTAPHCRYGLMWSPSGQTLLEIEMQHRVSTSFDWHARLA